MLRHNEELKKEIFVATIGSYVATQKFMLQHNEELKKEIFVATIGSYVATLIKEKRLKEN